MNITIKYFGLIAELTGKSEESLDVEAAVNSISTLQTKLEILYPELKNKSYSFAVNRTLVNDDTAIWEHDEIALLPPFSGG